MIDLRKHPPFQGYEDIKIKASLGKTLFLHGLIPAVFEGPIQIAEETVFCVKLESLAQHQTSADCNILLWFAFNFPWIDNQPLTDAMWREQLVAPGSHFWLVENTPAEVQPPNGPIIAQWHG